MVGKILILNTWIETHITELTLWYILHFVFQIECWYNKYNLDENLSDSSLFCMSKFLKIMSLSWFM